MSRVSHAVLSTSVLLALAACHAQTRGPVTGTTSLTSAEELACRGASFDADAAPEPCIHHSVGAMTAAPQGLELSLVAPSSARSGYDAGLVVEMKNLTSAPMPLDIEEACGTFEGIASNDKTTSFESECFGTCGTGPEPRVVRVTLEPGGVVKKKVKFVAVATRIVMDERNECVEKTTGGLPPGDYDLRVTLPWTEPVASDPTIHRAKVLEAKLSIGP